MAQPMMDSAAVEALKMLEKLADDMDAKEHDGARRLLFWISDNVGKAGYKRLLQPLMYGGKSPFNKSE